MSHLLMYWDSKMSFIGMKWFSRSKDLDISSATKMNLSWGCRAFSPLCIWWWKPCSARRKCFVLLFGRFKNGVDFTGFPHVACLCRFYGYDGNRCEVGNGPKSQVFEPDCSDPVALDVSEVLIVAFTLSTVRICSLAFSESNWVYLYSLCHICVGAMWVASSNRWHIFCYRW